MTTNELNAIVQAVMLELEKAGVDFDFKAETPQATDLVYVMRGTADRYMGITVKWQNLLDIIVQKATEAKDEAVSAKDIALQTLTTIQGIESNVSSMKSSVETTKGEVEALKSDVSAMKASVETSEANVTQMKSEVSEMKTSVEGTKTEVENIKQETAGLLDTKVNYSDSLTYEEIMATNPVPDLTNKVASASALKEVGVIESVWTNASPTSVFSAQSISITGNYKALLVYYRISGGYGTGGTVLIPKGIGINTYMRYVDNTSCFRVFTYNNNELSISSCTTLTPSVGTNDELIIPSVVFGIK